MAWGGCKYRGCGVAYRRMMIMLEVLVVGCTCSVEDAADAAVRTLCGVRLRRVAGG